MIGTAPLVIRQVGLINRSHVHAKPLPARWPRMRHDGDGVFTPHFPAEINNDGCAANDHLTFNRVTDWYVCAGEVDPFMLYDSQLQRSVASNTQICQDLTTVDIHTGHYRVALSGSATIVFGGTNTTYSWFSGQGDGNTGNTIRLQDGFADVSFGVSAPHTIGIRLDTNDDNVDAIELIDVHETPNIQVLKNNMFEQSDVYFYDIEGWYEDSKDTTVVPANTLGWLEGFNDSQIYTIFE